MIVEYTNAAMHQAHYEWLPDDKIFYGQIAGVASVYANATQLEDCRSELKSTLEDWLLLRIHKTQPIPEVNGLSL